MENLQTDKNAKKKVTASPMVSLRVKRETKKKILAEVARVNKKDFGKRVRPEQLLEIALGLLNESHLKKLQDDSMTNADRLEFHYRSLAKQSGNLSKEDFLAHVLTKL